MKIQYFPEMRHFGSMIFDPKENDGVAYGNDTMFQMSFQKKLGIPSYETGNSNTFESDMYHNIKIKRKQWKELNNFVTNDDIGSARSIISEIEVKASESPKFLQRSNDLHKKKEIQILK